MFAIVDCNNFYASCEQLFNPSLRRKPLIVLSNNDGCVISRSQEARELGVPMGAPAFEVKRQFDVISLSSNFPLYGDMSQRVIATLSSLSFPLEIYSIDECFLDLREVINFDEIALLCHSRVKQWTGIPTTVGIGPTKTLAKVANKWAKKRKKPFLTLKPEDIDALLQDFPVSDVWGVGRATTRLLKRYGITTALQLKEADDLWIRKKGSVSLQRTVFELRSQACLDLEQIHTPRKTALCSRSFKREIVSLEELREAISTFTSIAAEKLRKDNLVAHHLLVFIQSNKHKNGTYYANSAHTTLPYGSSDTPILLSCAEVGLNQIFKEGIRYKRAGVMLGELHSKDEQQLDLFHSPTPGKAPLMRTIDQINAKYGSKAVFYAAEGTEKRWQRRGENISPRYTTSWSEIPRAFVHNGE